MNFDLAFDRLIGNEGKYSNNPADPGGETMWGVTKRVALEFGYTGDMKALPRETAKVIARKGYWDRAHCDEYDPAIGFQVLDSCFNNGYGNGVRFLQRAANVVDDGAMGPVTIKAVAAKSVTDILMRFIAYRQLFETKISTWPTFGKGWAVRNANDLLFGAEDT